MNKKDVLELKRRFKKDACTFTRLCGCYVDSDRNKVSTFGETFLNLEDEEFYKYLEIAKKVMSGTIGNNILELEFPTAEEAPGGRQQFLMGLRESALKNDDLMDTFYDLVIENYSYAGNYLTDDGRPACSGYAHVKDENEQKVESDVERRSNDEKHERRPRVAHRA